MENLLLKYMSLRVAENPVKDKGAVITISREYGCEGFDIAKLLHDAILKKSKNKVNHAKWKIICKEIIEEAAKELRSSPEMLSNIVNSEKRGMIADIITSFLGKDYYNDDRIKQALRKIIREFADHGNVIIIGSAGCVIARHETKALHIRIIAPVEWRVKQIAEKFKLTLPAAKKRVDEMDNNRNNFVRYFDCNFKKNYPFDIIYNRSIISKKEIVSSIIKILEKRKLI